MKDEEVIAEAKRRYYPGCHVFSLGGNPDEEIRAEDLEKLYWQGDLLRAHHNCAIYDRRASGERAWAPILERIVNHYEIY